jgi:hypothetical protein
MALADWLQNQMLYIGNDSGYHLAGFMGIHPVVPVHRSRVWGFWGKRICNGGARGFRQVIGCITDIGRAGVLIRPAFIMSSVKFLWLFDAFFLYS